MYIKEQINKQKEVQAKKKLYCYHKNPIFVKFRLFTSIRAPNTCGLGMFCDFVRLVFI